MPLPALNDRKYLEKQYKDSSNLQARLSLHQRFSLNKYGWHKYVFDQIDLPAQCRILELGCGSGQLWQENIARIPAGWEITLSDFSTGMLEATRHALEKQHPFEFKIIDAQSIPFVSGSFDAVIANHMLYHVPDRSLALSEIQRVLKPAGHFYAATNGERHMIEIADLVGRFNHEPASWERGANPFTLENGPAQLSAWFMEIKLSRYESSLEVTEAAPLVDYILSTRLRIPPERQVQFRQFVSCELASHGGVFHVTQDGGLFASIRKGKK